MKQTARMLGLILIGLGIVLSGFWAVLYGDLCPNDPECPTLSLIDTRFIAMIGVGIVACLWGRKGP